MNLQQIAKDFDAKLDSVSSRIEKGSQKKHLRKYYVYGQIFFIFVTFPLLIISGILSTEVFTQYALVALGIASLTFVPFRFMKNIELLIFLTKVMYIIIMIYFVTRMGGIFTSGGLIFAGLTPVLFTLVFRKYKWMISVFTIYILTVCILWFLDDHLGGKEVLTAQQNKLYFLLMLTGVTSYIFIFALYARSININLERREALRLKEINEAKTRLYTNITHEFRTPLTVILGLADSMKDYREPEINHRADTIIRNGKSLLELVDRLLDLSKLESGKLSVNKIHGNIIPFLRYVFQLQEYYAQEKGLKFTFESKSQSYELDFDPEKTTTIVSNLLSNAIKFTPEGGEINMKVGMEDNLFNIEISDNGIGIPREKQEKIFDRFYQVDDLDTRKAGGTGIGLALTRELVILMGGTINLTSDLGSRTIFNVKLPVRSEGLEEISYKEYTDKESVNPEESKMNSVESSGNHENGMQKLLIIEDNKDVVSYLQSCYHNLFSIYVAMNGKEGYEMAIETVPDIIISDIMMPEIDGFELCKKLKDDYRTSHIPVILLTAKADIPSRIKGLEHGADAYMVKPFNQQELLVRINKLLELRRKLFLRYSNGQINDIPEDPLLKREDHFIKKITENINRSLHNENYDVQALCEEMAMSKSQLYRKFKALTNMSAAKYIRKLRLERARHLLLTTSMNITEVSYEVGMKTLSTFSELFKEEYGQSPREYVSEYNGNHQKA